MIAKYCLHGLRREWDSIHQCWREFDVYDYHEITAEMIAKEQETIAILTAWKQKKEDENK